MEKNKIKVIKEMLQGSEAMCLGKKGIDIILNDKFSKDLAYNLCGKFFYRDVLIDNLEIAKINSADPSMLSDEIFLQHNRQRVWRVPLINKANTKNNINIKRRIIKMKLKELIKR
ncbi:hypothetical protein [Anaerovorax sp. IOR16]|uniref:hypothetical protein n=1 Tax=Anaerovorax sp. IOR16 TaxID=2773458 RepID=UPI0019D08FBE|nr:hypothetical protein [Anaerovorax sp. IOR16]